MDNKLTIKKTPKLNKMANVGGKQKSLTYLNGNDEWLDVVCRIA